MNATTTRGITVIPIDSDKLWTPSEFRAWLSVQTKGFKNSRIEFVVDPEDNAKVDVVIVADAVPNPPREILIPHKFAPAGIMGAVTGGAFDASRCVCGKPENHPVHMFLV
jgi:hypothetical protein